MIMKKILGVFGLLILSLTLVACSQDVPIVFEPITVSGFELSFEIQIDEESAHVQVARILDAKPYPIEITKEMIGEILTEVEVTTQEFEFVLEMIDAKFTSDYEGVDYKFELPALIDSITFEGGKNVEYAVATFGELEFLSAGIFTYRIIQVVVNEDGERNFGWVVDEAVFYVTVTVLENEELGILEATTDTQNIEFLNIYISDIEYEVEGLIMYIWNEMIAQAYEEGYKYVEDEHGVYSRVAIEKEDAVVADAGASNNNQESVGNDNTATGENSSSSGSVGGSNNNNNVTTGGGSGGNNNTTSPPPSNNNPTTPPATPSLVDQIRNAINEAAIVTAVRAMGEGMGLVHYTNFYGGVYGRPNGHVWLNSTLDFTTTSNGVHTFTGTDQAFIDGARATLQRLADASSGGSGTPFHIEFRNVGDPHDVAHRVLVLVRD